MLTGGACWVSLSLCICFCYFTITFVEALSFLLRFSIRLRAAVGCRFEGGGDTRSLRNFSLTFSYACTRIGDLDVDFEFLLQAALLNLFGCMPSGVMSRDILDEERSAVYFFERSYLSWAFI